MPDAEIIVANLFLHHFSEEALECLGRKLPKSCRLILVCEPYRSPYYKILASTLRWVGASRVTLHDARVSIEAGFQGMELPEALRLSANHWTVQISRTWMGAYHLLAERL